MAGVTQHQSHSSWALVGNCSFARCLIFFCYGWFTFFRFTEIFFNEEWRQWQGFPSTKVFQAGLWLANASWEIIALGDSHSFGSQKYFLTKNGDNCRGTKVFQAGLWLETAHSQDASWEILPMTHILSVHNRLILLSYGCFCCFHEIRLLLSLLTGVNHVVLDFKVV